MNRYIRALLVLGGTFTAGLAGAWPSTWTTLSDGRPRPEFTPTVWMLWGLSTVQIIAALRPGRRRRAAPTDAP